HGAARHHHHVRRHRAGRPRHRRHAGAHHPHARTHHAHARTFHHGRVRHHWAPFLKTSRNPGLSHREKVRAPRGGECAGRLVLDSLCIRPARRGNPSVRGTL